MHPTQPVEIFGNVSMQFADLQAKFYGDRPNNFVNFDNVNFANVLTVIELHAQIHIILWFWRLW